MKKVVIEYDDSDSVSNLFQDAIDYCLFMKTDLIISTEKNKDILSDFEKNMRMELMKYYDEKIVSYKAMRKTIVWNNHNK